MKKIICLLCCACLLLPLFACAKNGISSNEYDSKGTLFNPNEGTSSNHTPFDDSSAPNKNKEIDATPAPERPTLTFWVLESGSAALISSQITRLSRVNNLVDKYEFYYKGENGEKDDIDGLRYSFMNAQLYDTFKFEEFYNILQTMSSEDIIERYGLSYNIEVEIAHDIESKGRITLTETDDALKVLNTRLLAGKGPDIIVLDRCPVEQLASSGLLSDLSAIAEECGIYENISDALRSEDGGLYYLPYKIDAPVIAGSPDLLSEINSIQDLAELMNTYPPRTHYSEELLNEHGPDDSPKQIGVPYQAKISKDPLMLDVAPLPENERSLFSMDSFLSDLNFFMLSLYYNKITEGNRLNSSALKEYFSLLESIAAKQQLNNDNIHPSIGFSIAFPCPMDHVGMSSMCAYYVGYSRLCVGMSGKLSFRTLAFTAQQKGYETSFAPFPAEKNYFTPVMPVAINAASPNQQLAQEFIRGMLNDNMQLFEISGDASGLPVTKSSVEVFTQKRFNEDLAGFYEIYISEDDYSPKKIYMPTDERLHWLKEGIDFPYDLDALISSFNESYIINAAVYDSIFTNQMRYLRGSISLEKAVENCENELMLYFAEKN